VAVLFYMDDGTKVWRLGNIEEVAVATSTVDERRALAGPQLGSEGASRAALEAPHVAVPLAQKPKAKASPSLGHSQETATRTCSASTKCTSPAASTSTTRRASSS